MDQYEHIRTAHRVYGESIKAIVRRTGHSRNTIRKALAGPYKGYASRKHQPYPVLGAYMDVIDAYWRIRSNRGSSATAPGVFLPV